MANYVKLAAVGFAEVDADHGTGERAVQHMIEYLDAKIGQVTPDQPDLIALPECCDRYASFNAEQRLAYYGHRGDRILDHLAKRAREHRCYLTYPAVRQADDGTWRNSIVLLDRKGQIAGIYNKNHVVVTETTEQGILCGSEAKRIECDFGSVGGVICFDLNFEALRLQYRALRPDILIFCSMYHGGIMQRFWAYDCRAHFLGAVCRLPSEVYNPLGERIAASTNYFDYVVKSVNLDCALAHLDFNWDKLKAMKAKYGPKADFHDPGLLAPVLVSSESNEFTVKDLFREFNIEPLDDYLGRSLAHHRHPANREKSRC